MTTLFDGFLYNEGESTEMNFTGTYSAAWTFNGSLCNDVVVIPNGGAFVVHTVPASKTFTVTSATFAVQGWGDGNWLQATIAGNDVSGAFGGGNIAFVMPRIGQSSPIRVTTDVPCIVTAGLNVVIDSVVSPRTFSYSISGNES